MDRIGTDLDAAFYAVMDASFPIEEREVHEEPWDYALFTDGEAGYVVSSLLDAALRGMEREQGPETDAENGDLLWQATQCAQEGGRGDVRRLGEYVPTGEGLIRHFGHPISPEEKAVVRVHERWHAIHHRLLDETNCVWTGFPKAGSICVELLAQLFSWITLRDANCPLAQALDDMTDRQPMVYQTWRAKSDYTQAQAINLYRQIRENWNPGLFGPELPLLTEPSRGIDRSTVELADGESVHWLDLKMGECSIAELLHRKLVPRRWEGVSSLEGVLEIVRNGVDGDAFGQALEGRVLPEVRQALDWENTAAEIHDFLSWKKGDLVVVRSARSAMAFCRLEADAVDTYEHRGGHLWDHTVGHPVTWYKWDENRYGPAPPAPDLALEPDGQEPSDDELVLKAWLRATSTS